MDVAMFDLQTRASLLTLSKLGFLFQRLEK